MIAQFALGMSSVSAHGDAEVSICSRRKPSSPATGDSAPAATTNARGLYADELLKDEGALPWVRREIFGGGAGRLQQLREAEARLRRWGL